MGQWPSNFHWFRFYRPLKVSHQRQKYIKKIGLNTKASFTKFNENLHGGTFMNTKIVVWVDFWLFLAIDSVSKLQKWGELVRYRDPCMNQPSYGLNICSSHVFSQYLCYVGLFGSPFILLRNANFRWFAQLSTICLYVVHNIKSS